MWLRLVYKEYYGKEVGLRTYCANQADLDDKLTRHSISHDRIIFLSVNDKEVEPSEILHLFERSYN